MHWPQAFAHPVFLVIWLMTYAIFIVPEIILSRRLRSSSEAHKADRGSMPIVIAAANLAVLVGFLSAGAFPHFALPHWRAAFCFGIAIWFAGMLLRWYSIYTLGRFFTFDVAISSGQQVVERGPYRWIRHPSSTGSLIAEVGFGLTLANSLALICPPSASAQPTSIASASKSKSSNAAWAHPTPSTCSAPGGWCPSSSDTREKPHIPGKCHPEQREGPAVDFRTCERGAKSRHRLGANDMNTPGRIPGELPATLLVGAKPSGNEWGWSIESFQSALAKAPLIGYACQGGQFQVLLSDGICEMYWLSADSQDRSADEPWLQYAKRSCGEVSIAFRQLITAVDFNKEASTFQLLKDRIARGWDVRPSLLFVAYFVTEAQEAELIAAAARL